MSFITAWLVRKGLERFVWLVGPALLGAALTGGGGAIWLSGWTDHKTAILLVVVAALCIAVYTTEAKWARTVILVIICGTLYIKGRIDEQVLQEALMNAAKEMHERTVSGIHQGYRTAAAAEQARQERVNQEASTAAAVEKAEWDAERLRLRMALEQAQKEAANDPKANDQSLSADAVKRIDQLRHNPRAKRKRSRRVPASRPKADYQPAQQRSQAQVDDQALPSLADVFKGWGWGTPNKLGGPTASDALPAKADRGRMDKGPREVRGVPPEEGRAGAVCIGAGCGINGVQRLRAKGSKG